MGLWDDIKEGIGDIAQDSSNAIGKMVDDGKKVGAAIGDAFDSDATMQALKESGYVNTAAAFSKIGDALNAKDAVSSAFDDQVRSDASEMASNVWERTKRAVGADNSIDATFEYSRSKADERAKKREEYIERGVDVDKIDQEQFDYALFQEQGGGSLAKKEENSFTQQLQELASSKIGEDKMKELDMKQQIGLSKGAEEIQSAFDAVENMLNDSFFYAKDREVQNSLWKNKYQQTLKKTYADWAEGIANGLDDGVALEQAYAKNGSAMEDFWNWKKKMAMYSSSAKVHADIQNGFYGQAAVDAVTSGVTWTAGLAETWLEQVKRKVWGEENVDEFSGLGNITDYRNGAMEKFTGLLFDAAEVVPEVGPYVVLGRTGIGATSKIEGAVASLAAKMPKYESALVKVGAGTADFAENYYLWNGLIANSVGMEKDYDPTVDALFSIGVGALSRASKAASLVSDGFASVPKADFTQEAGITRKEYEMLTSPSKSDQEAAKAMMYQRLSSGKTGTDMLTDKAAVDESVVNRAYADLNQSLARMRSGDDTAIDRAYRYLDTVRVDGASIENTVDRARQITQVFRNAETQLNAATKADDVLARSALSLVQDARKNGRLKDGNVFEQERFDEALESAEELTGALQKFSDEVVNAGRAMFGTRLVKATTSDITIPKKQFERKVAEYVNTVFPQIADSYQEIFTNGMRYGKYKKTTEGWRNVVTNEVKPSLYVSDSVSDETMRLDPLKTLSDNYETVDKETISKLMDEAGIDKAAVGTNVALYSAVKNSAYGKVTDKTIALRKLFVSEELAKRGFKTIDDMRKSAAWKVMEDGIDSITDRTARESLLLEVEKAFKSGNPKMALNALNDAYFHSVVDKTVDDIAFSNTPIRIRNGNPAPKEAVGESFEDVSKEAEMLMVSRARSTLEKLSEEGGMKGDVPDVEYVTKATKSTMGTFESIKAQGGEPVIFVNDRGNIGIREHVGQDSVTGEDMVMFRYWNLNPEDAEKYGTTMTSKQMPLNSKGAKVAHYLDSSAGEVQERLTDAFHSMFSPNAVLDESMVEDFFRRIATVMHDDILKYRADKLEPSARSLTIRDEFGNFIWKGNLDDALSKSKDATHFMGQIKVDADDVTFYKGSKKRITLDEAMAGFKNERLKSITKQLKETYAKDFELWREPEEAFGTLFDKFDAIAKINPETGRISFSKADIGDELVHELGHALMRYVPNDTLTEMRKLYDNAPRDGSYASTSFDEFFAEGIRNAANELADIPKWMPDKLYRFAISVREFVRSVFGAVPEARDAFKRTLIDALSKKGSGYRIERKIEGEMASGEKALSSYEKMKLQWAKEIKDISDRFLNKIYQDGGLVSYLTLLTKEQRKVVMEDLFYKLVGDSKLAKKLKLEIVVRAASEFAHFDTGMKRLTDAYNDGALGNLEWITKDWKISEWGDYVIRQFVNSRLSLALGRKADIGAELYGSKAWVLDQLSEAKANGTRVTEADILALSQLSFETTGKKFASVAKEFQDDFNGFYAYFSENIQDTLKAVWLNDDRKNIVSKFKELFRYGENDIQRKINEDLQIVKSRQGDASMSTMGAFERTVMSDVGNRKKLDQAIRNSKRDDITSGMVSGIIRQFSASGELYGSVIRTLFGKSATVKSVEVMDTVITEDMFWEYALHEVGAVSDGFIERILPEIKSTTVDGLFDEVRKMGFGGNFNLSDMQKLVTNLAKAKGMSPAVISESSFGKIFGLNYDSLRRNDRVSRAILAFSEEGTYAQNVSKANDIIRAKWDTFVQRNAFSVKYDSAVDEAFVYFTLETLKKFGYEIPNVLDAYSKLTKYEGGFTKTEMVRKMRNLYAYSGTPAYAKQILSEIWAEVERALNRGTDRSLATSREASEMFDEGTNLNYHKVLNEENVEQFVDMVNSDVRKAVIGKYEIRPLLNTNPTQLVPSVYSYMTVMDHTAKENKLVLDVNGQKLQIGLDNYFEVARSVVYDDTEMLLKKLGDSFSPPEGMEIQVRYDMRKDSKMVDFAGNDRMKVISGIWDNLAAGVSKMVDEGFEKQRILNREEDIYQMRLYSEKPNKIVRYVHVNWNNLQGSPFWKREIKKLFEDNGWANTPDAVTEFSKLPLQDQLYNVALNKMYKAQDALKAAGPNKEVRTEIAKAIESANRIVRSLEGSVTPLGGNWDRTYLSTMARELPKDRAIAMLESNSIVRRTDSDMLKADALTIASGKKVTYSESKDYELKDLERVTNRIAAVGRQVEKTAEQRLFVEIKKDVASLLKDAITNSPAKLSSKEKELWASRFVSPEAKKAILSPETNFELEEVTYTYRVDKNTIGGGQASGNEFDEDLYEYERRTQKFYEGSETTVEDFAEGRMDRFNRASETELSGYSAVYSTESGEAYRVRYSDSDGLEITELVPVVAKTKVPANIKKSMEATSDMCAYI